MMTTRSIVLMSFVLAASLSTARGEDGGTPRFASLTITTGTDTASVVLDSVRLGSTPFAADSIAPGRHIVRLVPSDVLSWLTTPLIDTVEAVAGAHLQLHYTLPAEIALLSEPSGAEVKIRDSLIGRTPLVIPRPGSTESLVIAMTREGFADTSLPFPASGNRVCRIALRRTGAVPAGENAIVKVGNISRSPTRLVVWGCATVAAGIATAWLKIQADGKSMAYQATGDPAAFASMRRLDRGAGVTLAITEACFAVLTYFLLID